MALTRCPVCKKPAVLVSSRAVGETYVRELGKWLPVVERRIACPAPAGCGGDEDVLVVYRIDLFQGPSKVRNVKRSCLGLS